jgi:hypothetical protein
MATTDGSIPTEIMRLLGQRGDDWGITAITPGTQRRYVPDGPLAPGQSKYTWSTDRVCGKKVTPPAIESVEDGYYARVVGNAIATEAWLRAQAWHSALAGSPNAVWLGTRCTGKMRLQSDNYYKCDQCGHISEDLT